MAARPRLRPAGFDELGLRRALGFGMLPLLVAAMAFLAAMALAGWVGAATLARHWRSGAGSALTAEVPDPAAPRPGARSGTRLAAVLADLRADPAIVEARPLGDAELARLLRPWLGAAPAALGVPLPAVVAVHLADPPPDPPALAALAARLARDAPGTVLETQGAWVDRLLALARSLQASAAAALAVVVAVAAAVIAVATRAGLAARREAIEIIHGLGATDAYVAGSFAARATMLAAAGAVVGAVAALPVLLALARIAAPVTGAAQPGPGLAGLLAALPAPLWLLLPGLPLAAAGIGFLTAQVTVRRWLRRLP